MLMCGLSALFYFEEKISFREFQNHFEKLSHRGNEPSRYLQSQHYFLGHTRLGFQDRDANMQPMESYDGNWIILFNGEIYNAPQLRQQWHDKIPFRTQSDTEIILNGFLLFQEKVCEKLDGEYAFVILKKDGSEIFASRDPFGVKPLFVFLDQVPTEVFRFAKNQYAFQTKLIQFASEIKGLVNEKFWNQKSLCKQFLGLYEPICTPFEHIFHIPPGGHLHASKKCEEYFQGRLCLNSKNLRNPKDQLTHFDPDFLENLRQNMFEATQDRLLSEIEIGVYLSGGIDSKIVAHELSKHPHFQKRTFSVTFQDQDYDEKKEILRFSQHLGLKNHFLNLDQMALEYSYPIAIYHSENIQPYTNGAAKWWLSRFTSQFVKGVQNGDGADEIFCGYPSYQYLQKFSGLLKEKGFEKFLGSLTAKQYFEIPKITPPQFQKTPHTTANDWAAGRSSQETFLDLYESYALWGFFHPLFEEIKCKAFLLMGSKEGVTFLSSLREELQSWYFLGFETDEDESTSQSLLLWQNYFARTHLPVQVLNWVGDRMEMANTLEGRTPFLSPKVTSLVSNLADHSFVNELQNKRILRDAYEPILQDFMQTPKKQFGAPFLGISDADNMRTLQNLFRESCGISGTVHTREINRIPQTYQQNYLQTLKCFSLVQDFLVDGKSIHRNLEWEQIFLNKNQG